MSIRFFESVFTEFSELAKNLSGFLNSRSREFIAEVIELLVEVLNEWPLEPQHVRSN